MMDNDSFLAPWICLAVMRLGSRMAARFDEEFAAQGITQAQFRLLLAIHFEGGKEGVAPSILADHLLIERATVSVLAMRLVERGLLTRLPGTNRRTHQLALTPEGERILEQVVPQAVALAHETLARLTRDELHQMQSMLQRLEAEIRATTGQPSLEARRKGNHEETVG